MKTTRTYRSCEIKSESIYIDGQLIYEQADLSFAKFIKGAYKHFQLNYPKFHKMDRLCKLAFVCAHLLLEQSPLNDVEPEEIAIVMANANSTLHTDQKHADSINDRSNYFPSPAVFVYTLPNIMVGEICIKYNIKGESVFFVSNEYDPNMLLNYSNALLDSNKAKICLTGWVEYTADHYYAQLHLIK
jgi:3-oxoacyl-(acyl-carrier-protein) synthase